MAKGLTIPKGYVSKLSLYRTQRAIGRLKQLFEAKLCEKLNLSRVSAPLFVQKDSGLNDDLNGWERPVEFASSENKSLQIVHSLAKWKRLALYKYGFSAGEGIYADMNAIRRDEETDNLHSIYVDQWDWEKVILPKDRCEEYLRQTVKLIVSAISEASELLKKEFEELDYVFYDQVAFVSSEQLLKEYPNLTPKQREYEITKKFNTVFITQIGKKLSNGEVHDSRAPDYDDWSLNGDLLVYHPVLDCALELSSMGIRVNKKSLDDQLNQSGMQYKKDLPFHSLIYNEELPLCIGGGIGQSRLCMLLLQKAHVGEVQVSIWPEEVVKECEKAGIILL